MFDSPLIIFDSLALFMAMVISGLAAFRAVSSRRVLATPLYRSRALWTGTVGLMVLLFAAWAILLENTGSSVTFGLVPPYGTPEFYAYVFLSALVVAVAFAWIDSTIRVALELDFLHRDALGWRRLRLVVGISVVAGIVVAQFATVTWELLTSVLLLGVPTSYEVAALVVVGRRVRDATMRRYMKWMGFLVMATLLQLATTYVSPFLNFPLTVFAYFLYVMTTSLLKTAPLSVAVAGTPAHVQLSPPNQESL